MAVGNAVVRADDDWAHGHGYCHCVIGIVESAAQSQIVPRRD